MILEHLFKIILLCLDPRPVPHSSVNLMKMKSSMTLINRNIFISIDIFKNNVGLHVDRRNIALIDSKEQDIRLTVRD